MMRRMLVLARTLLLVSLRDRTTIRRLLRYRSYANATARGLSAFRRQRKRRATSFLQKRRVYGRIHVLCSERSA
jgi:hypothetical protein